MFQNSIFAAFNLWKKIQNIWNTLYKKCITNPTFRPNLAITLPPYLPSILCQAQDWDYLKKL